MPNRSLRVSPHVAKQKDRRPNAMRRGYSHRWNKHSREFRRRHPICLACVDHHVRVACVDHIIPIDSPQDDLLMADWNHEPLCQRCHRNKTELHDERMRSIRHQVVAGLAEMALEQGSDAARNELLQRVDIWDRWLDLDQYEMIELSSRTQL